ncbi:hypothetical protein PMAG_a0676 [Pseudoalteromonas mariniglutinosa NCIMB 1770]|nr:hypothetical protein [Pseudoalteromonas mariniglutinosa NCIMB 1770]
MDAGGRAMQEQLQRTLIYILAVSSLIVPNETYEIQGE